MFKSKHSGWTFAGTRTPFGGSSGISNGFGIGDALASIDPGPAIGDVGNTIDQNITQPISQGLSEADTWVNRELPGGWALPAIVAAAYLTGYVDPSLVGEVGAEVGAGAEAGGGAGDMFAGYSATGSDAGFAGSQLTPAQTAALNAGAGAGTYVTPELMGPTYGELGVTGVPEGGMGPTYGEMGFNGLNQQAAIDAANAASQNAQIADALKTANQIRQGASTANSLSKLLTQGAGSGLTQSLGQLAQGANPQGQALTGVVRGNQNPFTFAPQQPIQDTRQAQLAKLLQQG